MTDSYEEYADKILADVRHFEKTIAVIDQIHDLASEVLECELSHAELNHHQLKLAALLSRLGSILADLNNHSNASISYRKLKRVNEFCSFKKMIDSRTERYFTDGSAGAEADLKCEEDLKREVGLMARYNKINVLYEDTSRLITAIQSYLKQEQRQAFAERNTP